MASPKRPINPSIASISLDSGRTGSTTAVSDRSAMRVKGKPAPTKNDRLGSSAKCWVPLRSITESASMKLCELSGSIRSQFSRSSSARLK
ncbi:hypothetical protein D9M70_466540 [compost metagenome]